MASHESTPFYSLFKVIDSAKYEIESKAKTEFFYKSVRAYELQNGTRQLIQVVSLIQMRQMWVVV